MIETLGWHKYKRLTGVEFSTDQVGRVAVENKNNYLVYTQQGEAVAIVRRRMLHKLKDKSLMPKVGDWVEISRIPNDDKVVIESVLPRLTKISRKNPERGEEQIIAANVDLILIVQGLDDDYNLRRLERYMLLAYQSKIDAAVVLNKADLAKDVEKIQTEVKAVAKNIPVLLVSALTKTGLTEIKDLIKPEQTIVVIGSSGVGKSTLINILTGSNLKVSEVRIDDSRGRHTTTRREMVKLPLGGVLIDTPGLRELETFADQNEIIGSFEDLEVLSYSCKYSNCDHVKSHDCAILQALEAGTIDAKRYNGFLKLLKSKEFEESRRDIKKERERKGKEKERNKNLKKILKYKYR